MSKTESMNKMIANYEWAGINSITFHDGRMVLLEMNFYSKENYFIGPIADTTIDSYLKYNSEYLASFDVFAKVDYKEFEVLAGDGSSEENGVIFVKQTSDNSLVWFAFFEISEPFKSVSVDENGVIHATTMINTTWKLSIENPLKIEIDFPEIERMP